MAKICFIVSARNNVSIRELEKVSLNGIKFKGLIVSENQRIDKVEYNLVSFEVTNPIFVTQVLENVRVKKDIFVKMTIDGKSVDITLLK